MVAEDRLPSIPSYFKMYVDPHTDLELTSNIPCPFHMEKTGKSFSYSKQLKVWRCFGACHCGGDVIELHRLNYRLKSRAEAKESLFKILGIDFKQELTFEKKKVEIDPVEVQRRRAYSVAVSLAKNPDDWDELDYILSKVPYDVGELEVFCATRGMPLTSSYTTPK